MIATRSTTRSLISRYGLAGRISPHATSRPFSSCPPEDDGPPQILVEHLTHENIPNATVTLLTLNRPKANAMGRTMIAQLQRALDALEQPPSPESNTTRCVVLNSSSRRVFSAGADLKERQSMTIREAHTFVNTLRHTFQRVSALPVPVIAALQGVALGGGLELALAADLRVASAAGGTQLGLPETSLAIVPGAGGTQRLPRLLGSVARAKELVWTGRRLDAAAAYECGLVQHVVNEDDEDDKAAPGSYSACTAFALELAWKIARAGPVAIRASKWAVDEGLKCGGDMEAALAVEEQAYQRVLETRDRLEGLAAFNEKRSPEYRGH